MSFWRAFWKPRTTKATAAGSACSRAWAKPHAIPWKNCWPARRTIGDRGAPSLHHFLASIEADDADIKREMEDSGKSVRVMTTHGAKGLEAPVVILADTAGAPDTREQSGIIVNGDEVFWSPRKDADDGATAAARAAVTLAAEREQARLLYVAMTRARDRLIVCGAALGNLKEGRAASSWHAYAEDGLRRLEAIECDTPFGKGLRWGASINAKAKERAGERAAPLPAWLFEPAPQEGPAPRTLAPSRLKPDEAPVFFRARCGTQRFKRGRLIHGLLERLPDMAPKTREQAARTWLKGRGIEGKAAKALADEALAVIAHPDFAGAFAPGSRAEVPIVGVTPSGQRIAGAIDRLRSPNRKSSRSTSRPTGPPRSIPRTFPALMWPRWRPTPPFCAPPSLIEGYAARFCGRKSLFSWKFRRGACAGRPWLTTGVGLHTS